MNADRRILVQGARRGAVAVHAVAVLFAVALSTVAVARSSERMAATRSQSPARLGDLEFPAGHCWRGTFPDSSATDTHCYSWRVGKAFLRDSHAVIGRRPPYYGETLYGWDRARSALKFWYFNSLGDVSTGHATRSGTDLVFPETIADISGRREIQTVWTHESDAYSVVVREQRAGAWRELWHMTLRRLD
jgi:hypothetical protein